MTACQEYTLHTHTPSCPCLHAIHTPARDAGTKFSHQIRRLYREGKRLCVWLRGWPPRWALLVGLQVQRAMCLYTLRAVERDRFPHHFTELG